MFRSLFIGILILGCIFLFMGDSPTKDLYVLYPQTDDSLSYDQSKLVFVSALSLAVPELLVSTEWETEQLMVVEQKADKENFPKEFYKLFQPTTTLQSFEYSFKFYNGFSIPETLTFAYTDTVSIKTLWQKKEFTNIVKSVMTKDVLGIIVKLRGWRDSIYTPVYDDPNGEGRSLYKITVKLIPGANSIYFASSGDKSAAVSYTTTYLSESKPTTDRTALFHNSVLEQSCTTCHEGLPSVDSGKTMTADCNVCHKGVSTASHVHAPVESKECSSCHSWSEEKHAVVLEMGVPETCYGCHDDKKNLIDSAAVQHPVASDCATCHSPHGTDEKQMLKKPVFYLCTGCHEDQKINHPVGRHPLRFLKNGAGEELTCTTCHTPHGSQHASLLKLTDSSSDICSQCH